MTIQTAAPGSQLPTPALRAGEETLEYQGRRPTEFPGEPGADVLACGFGMTVAAWITAYLTRMPIWGSPAPGQVTIVLMLAMVFCGGFVAARYSAKGVWAAVLAGTVSGILDTLVVLSLAHDSANHTSTDGLVTASAVPAAALWTGGSVILNTFVAGLGGALGGLFPAASRGRIRWTAVFVLVLAAATLPLITAGGLVTAFGAGLAVPDWPESYGYNMFLFPLSKMQSASGNFYEHAHRLMGSLVGTTALTLAIYVSATRLRRQTVLLIGAWAIGTCVAIQGIMGGLRVTEKSIPLATVHGIFAQIVFASLACLAAASLPAFRGMTVAAMPELPGRPRSAALPYVLVGSLLVQLTLGALVRQHVDAMIVLHVSMAAVVAMLAGTCGFRAFVLHGTVRPLRRAGLAVMVLVSVQLLLGIVALVVRPTGGGSPTTTSALFTTAHQANGALLLATSAVLALWTWRLREQEAGTGQQPIRAR